MFCNEYENRLLRQCSEYEGIAESPRKIARSSKDFSTQSPVKSPRRILFPNVPVSNCDRFIPLRSSWDTDFFVPKEVEDSAKSGTKRIQNGEESAEMYSSLLRNEMFGSKIEEVKENCLHSTPKKGKKLFTYSPSKPPTISPAESPTFSLSPVSSSSQRLLRTPKKSMRKISKIPFKVLDAPDLQDDFYLNLVDWSSQNTLGVGLGPCVYLWSASNSHVTRLCDLTENGGCVTSVCWNAKGNILAIGTQAGSVQLWDVGVEKLVSSWAVHGARVGTLAWNGDELSSGSRDRCIYQKDIRVSPHQSSRRLVGHRQEVCGLKWSPDFQYLASGGNDNRIFIWSPSSIEPLHTFMEHKAAVKAIAWSPHNHGLLASGGGTADRKIRFWNILTNQPMNCIDTGSQVCNLAWSKHSSELVSTHGYSQNQIIVWKYPSLNPVVKLTGHSFRVLYLAMSPDGESIVTGAGDETLRFWNIFSKNNYQKECKSVLNLFTNIR